MCYNTKVVPDMENAPRELGVHMNHPEPEHLKALGILVSYLKVK